MVAKKSAVGRGAHGFLDKAKKPYLRALKWSRAPHESKEKLGKARASDWRKIAELGAMGARLDDIGAPYYVVRWVAAPGRARPTRRQARFDAAMATLALGPMTNARWRALKMSDTQMHGKDKLYVRPGSSGRLAEEAQAFAALFALHADDLARL